MTRMFRNSWQLFRPILAGASFQDRLIACLGAMFGIGITAFICLKIAGTAASPWLVAPLGASAVLLFAVPASPLAQPWPIIGGNVLSAIVGVIAAQSIPSTPIAAAVAVGGAILLMSLLRCLHPPGGAAALTAVIGGKSIAGLGFLFPLIPIGLNSVLLVLTGLMVHRVSGHSYPHRAPPAAGGLKDSIQPFDVQTADFDLALEDLGETFDIRREDLEVLFRRAEYHGRRRRAGSG